MQTIDRTTMLKIENITLSDNEKANLSLKYLGNTIKLTTTYPNYGGIRYWFICPLCKKRVATLHEYHTYYLCRVCSNLYYTSQEYHRGDEADLILSYLIDIRAKYLRLSRASEAVPSIFDVNFLSYVPTKPKGMHYVTYTKKINEIEAMIQTYIEMINIYNNLKHAHKEKIDKQYNQAVKYQEKHFKQ